MTNRVMKTLAIVSCIMIQASWLSSYDAAAESYAAKDPIGVIEERRKITPRTSPEALLEQLSPTKGLSPGKAMAPGIQTQFPDDADGDGMTDAAELKYGFDPLDPNSFPTEPDLILPFFLPESGMGASYDIGSIRDPGITIRWENPAEGSYMLTLYNGDQLLYYGGHFSVSAPVNYTVFNLSGTETLTGHFQLYDAEGQWAKEFPEFTIDLSQIVLPQIGAPDNRITYTFSEFPPDMELLYREFLKRLLPLMYYYLGPPAETFNCVITNMGHNSDYFMIVDDGRTFLSNTAFIPRLIAHELVHAWKGHYLFASDGNWYYNPALSGLEEGTAEGTAFEIMHEYVRSYPNDEASLQLLSWRPYQYWSSETTYYDSVRHNRDTGSGDFWDPSAFVYDKYSTAATTWQIMMKKNPFVYKNIMQRYFAKINSDPAWRPNRSDLLELWAEEVPQINGVDLRHFLSTMPVFNEGFYDEGQYVLSIMRPYGDGGDQQFGTTYANKDGKAWWGISENKINEYHLPEWVPWIYPDPRDSYIYLYTQDQPFTVTLYNQLNQNVSIIAERTAVQAAGTFGYGLKIINELGMGNYPIGLYRETVTFDNFLQHDPGAREDFYFFGMKNFIQDKDNEYVIMIGVDGVRNGTVHITLSNGEYVQPLIRGAAVFRSKTWPFDMEGEFPIVVTNSDGFSHTYYRTLLEAGTARGFFQHQFIILDKDFDGVEDHLQAFTTGISAVRQDFHADGGSGSVSVFPSAVGTWTAVSNVDWIVITSGNSGSGKRSVYYDVAPNTTVEARSGTLTADGRTVVVNQAGVHTGAPVLTINPVVTPTNQDALIISGTVESAVQVYIVTATSSGLADVTGTTWSYTAAGLAEGENTLTVTALDQADGQTNRSVTIMYLDDVVPPQLTINGPVTPTNQNGQLISGTIEAGPIPIARSGIGASYEVGIQEINIVWKNPEQGTYALSLYNGDQQLYYGGHYIENAPVNFNEFNLTGTEILSGFFQYYDGNGFFVTNYQEFKIALSMPSVTVKTNTNASAGPVAVSGTAWNCTIAGLAAGDNTVTVTAKDYVGNTTEKTIVINYRAVNAPIVTGVSLTKNTRPTWTWTSGGGGNGTYRCKLDNGLWKTTTATFFRPRVANTLGESSHTLYVQERDKAGNWSDSGSFTIEIDLTPIDPPSVSGVSPTNKARPVWAWTSGGRGSGTYRRQLDGGTWVTTTAQSFKPESDLALGAHTLSVQEKDLSGNWSASGSFTIEIVKLLTPPASPTGLNGTRWWRSLLPPDRQR